MRIIATIYRAVVFVYAKCCRQDKRKATCRMRASLFTQKISKCDFFKIHSILASLGHNCPSLNRYLGILDTYYIWDSLEIVLKTFDPYFRFSLFIVLKTRLGGFGRLKERKR